MRSPGDALATLFAVARVSLEEEIRYPAAAMAYYAFVSFVPLVVLAFAFLGPELVEGVQEATPRFVTGSAQRLVYESTTSTGGSPGATVIAALVLGWSGINVVLDFQTVVRRVEDVPPRSAPGRVRDGVAILGSLSLAVVAILVTSWASGVPPGEPVVGVPLLFLALTAAFLPLYAVTSRRLRSPAAALPGALASAAGWTVIHFALQFYVAFSEQTAVFGVISGIIIILTSLYVAAAVLLTGVVVNAVLAGARTESGL